MRKPGRPTFVHAAIGVVAGVFGMAVAHLVAAVMTPASSPVLAVGSTVIDATPTPVKEWAVKHFGTADKPILIGNVLLITLLATALIGVLARTRLRLAMLLMVALVVLAGVAVAIRPLAAPLDAVPTLVAAVLGPLALAWLTRIRGNDTPANAPADDSDPARGASRRSVLVGSGILAAGAAVAVAGGQWIIAKRNRISDIVLPKPASPLPPLADGLDQKYGGISSFRTSNADFYRVDTKLAVPIVDVDSWSLTIDGDVDRKVTFSYEDLRSMQNVENDITLTCVSNEVGGKLVGAARWTGVPLSTLLDRAGVGSKADQLLSTDVEGFTISSPLEAVMDGRDAMIALGMNGEVLPRKHGFPARLIVPGLYGFVGATKWVTRLTLTTYADRQAYWTKRKWATDAPIKTSARIDTPRPLSTIKSGDTVIGGVAWAQHRGIGKVEVRVDGGEWQEARLGPDAGLDYWRQWYLPWNASKGSHMLAVRAYDRQGEPQLVQRATPFPSGSSGIQEIVVTAV